MEESRTTPRGGRPTVASSPRTARPTEARCPHCGRVLHRRTLTVVGKTYLGPWEECQCPGAVEDRRREEQRRRDEEASQRAQEARRRAERLLRDSDIPERYNGASTGLRMPEGRGRGLYLFGPVGTGKTHAACALALRAISEGTSARFATLAGIASRVRSSYGRRSGEAEEEVVNELVGCGLLVVDDLGKERATDFSLSLLYRIVDGRYGAMRPIVVTSNYPLPALAARLAGASDEEMAGAIVSRLAGTCDQVALGGPDRRLNG